MTDPVTDPASTPVADVWLVTCAPLPQGEPGGHLLVEALAARDVRAAWVAWDDPHVDWAAALTCVRSTWDYDSRRDEFLSWARTVPRLLNSADVFAWNTDKAYLAALADAGLTTVPTQLVEGQEELPAAIAETWTLPDGAAGVVVKPRVAAGGRGVTVFDLTDGGPPDLDESGLGPGPWVVQPLLASIRTEGEWSTYVVDGRLGPAARKLPASGEIRVHEAYGGRTVAVELTEELATLATRAVGTAEEVLGERLDYARVDAMRTADGELVLSELEVTEPGLYLDVLPEMADVFADLVVRRLRDGA